MCENLSIYIVCIWGPGLECLSSRATRQAPAKHPSSTPQAPPKHPSSTLQARLTPSTPVFDPFLGLSFSTTILLPFWTDFCSMFDQFSDPLDPPKSCWRVHESSIFTFSTFFFRGRFSDPKMTPKRMQKLRIWGLFWGQFWGHLTPGPLPEPPGAILDALRALRELFGSSLKLLNHFKIDILTLLGALGTLLGPQERPKSPNWSQNAPEIAGVQAWCKFASQSAIHVQKIKNET